MQGDFSSLADGVRAYIRLPVYTIIGPDAFDRYSRFFDRCPNPENSVKICSFAACIGIKQLSICI